MATPKKKHLIELMIEAGVKWPDGAEYAAQDKRGLKVNFYKGGKPNLCSGLDAWMSDKCTFMRVNGVTLPSICRNWHQTIVTREQYAEAVSANVGSPAVMASKSNQVRESEDVPAVDSGEWHNPPSIEQLTADYHAKAAEADRLQSVADEALKAADNALIALQKAGKLIGLLIAIDTNPKPVEQPVEQAQPEITYWRDLRVGDVIECIPYGDERDNTSRWPGGWATCNLGTTHVVESIDPDSGKISLLDTKDSGYAFRFIRRP